MADKKIYNSNDLNDFATEYAKLISTKFNELNADKNIIHPTALEFKEMANKIMGKLTDTNRCLGIHLTGKNKNKRCQAAPHYGSRYCLKHRSQDTENKKIYETNPEILKEAIELFKKTKLNDQESNKTDLTDSMISELLENIEKTPENKELYKKRIFELINKNQLK